MSHSDLNIKQNAMATLRERYLFLISNLSGKDCQIRMYENTDVKAQVVAFDSKFENIIVENLQTPLPAPIKSAILRTSDVISMQFDCDSKSLINKNWK